MSLQRHAGSARILFVALALAASGTVGLEAQATGVVSGTVVDRDSRNPVENVVVTLLSPAGRHQARSDARGVFRLEAIPAGNHVFRLEHLAYGTLTSAVEVAAGEESRLQVTVAPQAILLQPLEVFVLSREAEEARGRGTRRNEVDRATILSPGNSHLNVAEILGKYVPGLNVRRQGGGTVCLEYRGPSSLQRDRQGCRSPLVYMDGVPVMAPTTLYAQLPPETIQRMEFLSPAEAGARYGTGSMFGVLLIETRRPGADPEGAAERQARLRAVQGSYRHDWAAESARHPWARVLATTLAANAAGLALGTAAAGHCITESPRADGYVSNCGGMATTTMAGVAVLLPALSSSLAARYAGSTAESRGTFTAAAVLSALALVPGYGLILSSEGNMDSGVAIAGQLLLALGTPVVVTVADHLFRSRR